MPDGLHCHKGWINGVMTMALNVLTMGIEALERSAGKDGEPSKCYEK
jgi:hypothetical protein